MDKNWQRTYNALRQLYSEIQQGKPEAGAAHLTEKRRVNLLDSIDLVANDVDSVARLGAILLSDAGR